MAQIGIIAKVNDNITTLHTLHMGSIVNWKPKKIPNYP